MERALSVHHRRARSRWSDIGLRQVKGERAALAGRAAQLNFAAQQAGQFAADGQSQSGSAVLAAGAGVCLLEGLEDDALFLRRNADAGIGDFEGDDRRGAAENRMIFAPSFRSQRYGQMHAALFGELECIRQQVLQHLLQTLRVGDQAARKVRIGMHLECKPPVLRLVPEGPSDHVQQAGEEDFLGFDRNRARLDLRKIENVADQVEQIGSRAVNGARELDLLGRQVAIGIVAELLAQNQNAVQRRAQLVRHVGQEFGLVLGGERQFFGFFFQARRGLFDFLILAFHFDVLFGELLRFLRQLLVGLLQFSLLRLQFGGQLLRLLQQAFGLHRGFNAVQHDADAGGELLKEGQMRSGECCSATPVR